MMNLQAAPADIDELVNQFFVRANAPYGPLLRPSNGVELVRGTLYQYRVAHPQAGRSLLTIFLGLDTLGGELWEREIRVLLSLSQRTHAHLPKILDGRHVSVNTDRPFAYVLTEAGIYDLTEPGALDYVTWNRELLNHSRGYALQQYVGLLYDVSRLHRRGVIHRNIGPHAIEYVESEDENRPFSLRIARFEMSSFTSDLIRGGDESVPPDSARKVWDPGTEPVRSASVPPERLPFLRGEVNEPDETDRADVFSLGALGWAILVRMTSENAEYLDDDSRARRLAQEDQSALSALEAGELSEEGFRAYMERRCREPDVAPELGRPLSAMLSRDPRARPSLVQVVADLREAYGVLQQFYDPRPETQRLLLGYMPKESAETIYKPGYISVDPAQDDTQLREFMEVDLRGAQMLYCPDGFMRWGPSSDPREKEKYARARYVILGAQIAWFCDVFRQFGARFRGSSGSSIFWDLLLVKYALPRNRAFQLEDTPLQRSIPMVRLYAIPDIRQVDMDDVRAVIAECAGNGEKTDWKDFLRSLEYQFTIPEWMVTFGRALEFLLETQRAALRARVFPFVRRTSGMGQFQVLQHDPDRERREIAASAERTLYFSAFPREMGSFYRSLDGAESTSAVLAVFGDDGKRLDPRRDAVGKVQVTDGQAGRPDSIEVRAITGGGDWIPERGWLKPINDEPSELLLRRQEDAVRELLVSDGILSQLHAPFTSRGLPYRWQGVASDLDESGQNAALDMLCCRPFYALHGPPGAGKTAVAARAIARFLDSEPGARVLVTSQNHLGLDNLALEILEQVKKAGLSPVVVRVISEQARADEKPHPRMISYGLRDQAHLRASEASDKARLHLERGELPDGTPIGPEMASILAFWKDGAVRCELELRDRLRRASTLVFATTGACSPAIVGGASPEDAFDWVVVEEAAHAWPIELAMPLVRGYRWTLIGDHLQLPAYERQKLSMLLQACEESDVDALKAHAAAAPEYEKVFDLFGTLFAGQEKRGRLDEPLGRLDTQHRMRVDIANLVGRAFYRIESIPRQLRSESMQRALDRDPDASWLKSGRNVERPHLIRSIPFFLDERGEKERAVAWLATDGLRDAEDLPYWSNKGEARLIATLVGRLHPMPRAGRDGFLQEPIVILTPYLRQVDELKQAVPSLSDQIYTVDGFQGRQADIVIVSLVRSVMRGSTPESSIGYLVEPSRVNVMFSRARRLLVIVGNYGHFRGIVNRFADRRKDLLGWRCLLQDVEKKGHLVDGKKVAAWMGDR